MTAAAWICVSCGWVNNPRQTKQYHQCANCRRGRHARAENVAVVIERVHREPWEHGTTRQWRGRKV